MEECDVHFNTIALSKAKILGFSKCNRVNSTV